MTDIRFQYFNISKCKKVAHIRFITGEIINTIMEMLNSSLHNKIF